MKSGSVPQALGDGTSRKRGQNCSRKGWHEAGGARAGLLPFCFRESGLHSMCNALASFTQEMGITNDGWLL